MEAKMHLQPPPALDAAGQARQPPPPLIKSRNAGQVEGGPRVPALKLPSIRTREQEGAGLLVSAHSGSASRRGLADVLPSDAPQKGSPRSAPESLDAAAVQAEQQRQRGSQSARLPQPPAAPASKARAYDGPVAFGESGQILFATLFAPGGRGAGKPLRPRPSAGQFSSESSLHSVAGDDPKGRMLVTDKRAFEQVLFPQEQLPTERQEVAFLSRAYDSLLANLGPPPAEPGPGRWLPELEVHDVAMNELVRQVGKQCRERGALLERVRRRQLAIAGEVLAALAARTKEAAAAAREAERWRREAEETAPDPVLRARLAAAEARVAALSIEVRSANTAADTAERALRNERHDRRRLLAALNERAARGVDGASAAALAGAPSAQADLAELDRLDRERAEREAAAAALIANPRTTDDHLLHFQKIYEETAAQQPEPGALDEDRVRQEAAVQFLVYLQKHSSLRSVLASWFALFMWTGLCRRRAGLEFQLRYIVVDPKLRALPASRGEAAASRGEAAGASRGEAAGASRSESRFVRIQVRDAECQAAPETEEGSAQTEHDEGGPFEHGFGLLPTHSSSILARRGRTASLSLESPARIPLALASASRGSTVGHLGHLESLSPGPGPSSPGRRAFGEAARALVSAAAGEAALALEGAIVAEEEEGSTPEPPPPPPPPAAAPPAIEVEAAPSQPPSAEPPAAPESEEAAGESRGPSESGGEETEAEGAGEAAPEPSGEPPASAEPRAQPKITKKKREAEKGGPGEATDALASLAELAEGVVARGGRGERRRRGRGGPAEHGARGRRSSALASLENRVAAAVGELGDRLERAAAAERAARAEAEQLRAALDRSEAARKEAEKAAAAAAAAAEVSARAADAARAAAVRGAAPRQEANANGAAKPTGPEKKQPAPPLAAPANPAAPRRPPGGFGAAKKQAGDAPSSDAEQPSARRAPASGPLPPRAARGIVTEVVDEAQEAPANALGLAFAGGNSWLASLASRLRRGPGPFEAPRPRQWLLRFIRDFYKDCEETLAAGFDPLTPHVVPQGPAPVPKTPRGRSAVAATDLGPIGRPQRFRTLFAGFLGDKYGNRRLVEQAAGQALESLASSRGTDPLVDAFANFATEAWGVDIMRIFARGFANLGLGPEGTLQEASVEPSRAAAVIQACLGRLSHGSLEAVMARAQRIDALQAAAGGGEEGAAADGRSPSPPSSFAAVAQAVLRGDRRLSVESAKFKLPAGARVPTAALLYAICEAAVAIEHAYLRWAHERFVACAASRPLPGGSSEALLLNRFGLIKLLKTALAEAGDGDAGRQGAYAQDLTEELFSDMQQAGATLYDGAVVFDAFGALAFRTDKLRPLFRAAYRLDERELAYPHPPSWYRWEDLASFWAECAGGPAAWQLGPPPPAEQPPGPGPESEPSPPPTPPRLEDDYGLELDGALEGYGDPEAFDGSEGGDSDRGAPP